MQIGKASGTQIAILTVAALILTVPVIRWVVQARSWAPEEAFFLERFLTVLPLAVILVVVPSLRRWCRQQLAIPLSPAGSREALLVAGAMLLVAFAVMGAFALHWWAREGDAGLSRWASGWASHQSQMTRALSASGLAALLISATLIPLVEELIHRGLIYKAWEERWGPFVAAILSSAVFGLCHFSFWAPFMIGVLLCALYRRTGSLLAPIVAHGIYNATIWYPLLGQFTLPATLSERGDITNWKLQLSALAVVLIVIPLYLALGRRERTA